jgi:hypothetical protein
MLFLSEVEWESEVHPGQQAVWEETVGSEWALSSAFSKLHTSPDLGLRDNWPLSLSADMGPHESIFTAFLALVSGAKQWQSSFSSPIP